MIADETLRWALAMLLWAATVYSVCRAAAAAGPAGRVGTSLRALMTAAMALMLVPGGRWALLPQLFLFALGAWWFVLQAVRHRTRTRDRRSVIGQGKPLYDAAAMGSMAFMLAVVGLWEDPASGALPPAPGALVPAPHHAGAAAVPLAAPEHAWSVQPPLVPAVAWGLAVVFALAAVLWIVRLLLQLWPLPGGPPVPAALRSQGRRPRVRPSAGFQAVADTAVEAVGAAVIALMLAGLAA